MPLDYFHRYLTVGPSKRGGRGVFAKVDIPKGKIFITDGYVECDSKTLPNYIYATDDGQSFVALGLSSLINHGGEKTGENCYWLVDEEARVIRFKATKDIKAGQELLHNYRWAAPFPKGWIK